MLKFHPLSITERAPVADDAVALTFAVPPALVEEYRFKGGQHVAIRCVVAGREERRTYSIVNAEGSGSLTVGVRLQSGGRMSEYLARHAQPGASFDVMTPNGSFHAQDRSGPRRSAGSVLHSPSCP